MLLTSINYSVDGEKKQTTRSF